MKLKVKDFEALSSIDNEGVSITFGRAKKPSWDMTLEDGEAIAAEINIRVRRNAFAHNLPVYFIDCGFVCAEYPNGTIEQVRKANFSLEGV